MVVKQLEKYSSKLKDEPIARVTTRILQPTIDSPIKPSPVAIPNVFEEVKLFRTEYLQSGGKDAMILSEINKLEQGLMNMSSNEQSFRIPGFGPNNDSSAKRRENELLDIEFQKDILIAERELEELKIDLMQASQMDKKVEVHEKYPAIEVVYSERRGFEIHMVQVTGYSPTKSKIDFTFALFEGSDCINQSFQTITSTTSQINQTLKFKNIIGKPNVRLIIDVRLSPIAGERSSSTQIAFGWTIIDLFNSTSKLSDGAWSMDLYAHPIDFDMSCYTMQKSKRKVESASVFFQIRDPLHEPLKIAMEDYVTKPTEQIEILSIPKQLMLVPSIMKKMKQAVPELQQKSLPIPQEVLLKKPSGEAAKKFAFGIQLIRINGFDGLVEPTIRLLAVDNDTKTAINTFPKLDQGIEEGSFGWQFGAYHEIPSIGGIPGRKGVFEIISDSRVVGRAPFEMFKFHFAEAYDINDGLLSLQIETAYQTVAKPTLDVRIYKPKFGSPPIERFVSKLVTPATTDDAFILIPAVYSFSPPTEKIYISVDAIRFLPASATVTKVVASIYSIFKRSFIKGTEVVSSINLDEPVYSPSFGTGLKLSCAIESLDRSCVLVLKVYTIEFYTHEVEVIGGAILNLFVDTETNQFPTKNSAAYSPWFGAFQAPILYVNLNNEFLKSQVDMSKLPGRARISCATLLVRLSHKDIPPPPPYSSRVYQTVAGSEPRPSDLALYYYCLVERKGFTMRDRLLSLGDGIPKTARHTQDSLLKWTKQRLEITDSMNPPLIDASYLCLYDLSYGFSFSLESAQNLTWKGYTIAIMSFVSNLYTLGQPYQPTFPDDATYTHDIDLTSPFKSPKWKDGFRLYRNRAYDSGELLVIQLLAIVLVDQVFQVRSQGWTVIPPFHVNKYVRHGTFLLPLFEAFPTQEILAEYWKDEEWRLEDAISSRSIGFTKNYASLQISICDTRRKSEIENEPKTETLIRKEYLGEFTTKFKSPAISSSYSNTISSLKAKKQSDEEYSQMMINTFVEATSLPYVP